MSNLHGRTVLITGAKGGLGAEVTKAFLASGAQVIGVSRTISANDFPHERFVAIPGEAGTREGARRIVSESGPVDVVVHLVGGFHMGPLVEETELSVVQRMLDLNLATAWNIFAAAIGEMKERGWGRLLAVGSRAVLEPGAGTSAYNVAKAALVALVRSIAAENRRSGVTANIVLPGTIDTPANREAMPDADFSRWVRGGDIAALLLYLASDAGAPVNGAAIPILGY